MKALAVRRKNCSTIPVPLHEAGVLAYIVPVHPPESPQLPAHTLGRQLNNTAHPSISYTSNRRHNKIRNTRRIIVFLKHFDYVCIIQEL